MPVAQKMIGWNAVSQVVRVVAVMHLADVPDAI
jgi:hypothetical protein